MKRREKKDTWARDVCLEPQLLLVPVLLVLLLWQLVYHMDRMVLRWHHAVVAFGKKECNVAADE